MLSLQLKSGEYLTIGNDIAVQVFQNGPTLRVAVKAPREVPILRGEVLERNGEGRPEGLRQKRPKSPSEKAHDARKLEKLVLRREREAEAREAQSAVLREMQAMLDRMDSLGGEETREEISALRKRLDWVAAQGRGEENQ